MKEYLPYFAGLVALVFGGGGIYALIKVKPEAQAIVVNAAQGAVVVQSGVIEDLREELDAQRLRISEQDGEIKFLKDELAKCNDHRAGVQKTAKELAERVESLEELTKGA